jgi:acetoin utilization protein AcuB
LVRLKVLSGREVCKILSDHGFVQIRQKGSHVIMQKKIITIPPDTTIERAASIMQQHRISALPVVEKEKLAGIITTSDVMEVLLEAIGVDRDSFRFTVLVKDRIGAVAEVSKILQDEGINIRSLITWPEKKHPGVYQLVLRVSAADEQKAVSALSEAGFSVLTEYVQDLTPYLPKA